MKFVHLTFDNAVPRIKRSGLRLGHGRLGRGVYALPLINWKRWKTISTLYQVTEETAHGPVVMDKGGLRFVQSLEMTNLREWLWHLRIYHRRARFAAVIFELGPEHWPVLISLKIHEGDESFLRALRSRQLTGCTVDWKLVDDYEEELASLVIYARNRYLPVSVDSPRALGRLLHIYVSREGGFCQSAERIEVLIRKPVPRRQIKKIIPFYRTGSEFRHHRRRLQKDPGIENQ